MAGAQDLPRRRALWLRRKRRDAVGSMSVVEHLEELRGRIFKSFIAFTLVSIVAFTQYDPVLDFLLEPLCQVPARHLGDFGCELVGVSPMEFFFTRLKVTAMVGIIASSPVWLYQLWAYVVPALTSKEKRYALPFVLTSVVMFVGGAFFAYSLMPTGLRILIGLGGENINAFFRAEEYLNFVGLMLIAFGVTFLLPLILFYLGLAGVVGVDRLRRSRKIALVSIALLAAVVTPTQDPYTMVVLATPLYAMYELTILALSIVQRRRKRAEQDA